MKSHRFRPFVLGVIAAASLAVLGCNKSGDTATQNASLTPITILKYSDYQCPACKVVIPMEKQLKEEFGDLVSIEYRHFPLSGHRYAALAAQSVEAARKQGKYQEMHDLIFARQELWSAGNAERLFLNYAQEIGLDTQQFTADQTSDEIVALVESQRREGSRRLVPGTPTYFINGTKISTLPRNYEQFRSLALLYMKS